MTSPFMFVRCLAGLLCAFAALTYASPSLGQSSGSGGKSPRTSGSKGKSKAGGGVSNNEKLPSGRDSYRARAANLRQESPLTTNPAGGAGRAAVGASRPSSPRTRSGSDPGPPPQRIQYSQLPNRASASFDPNTAIVGSRRASISMSSSSTSAQAAKRSAPRFTEYRQQELVKYRLKLAVVTPQVQTGKAAVQGTRGEISQAQSARQLALDRAKIARDDKRAMRPGWNPFSAKNRRDRAQKNDFRREQKTFEAQAKEIREKEIPRLQKQEAAQLKSLAPLEAKQAKYTFRKEYFKTQLRERSGVENP